MKYNEKYPYANVVDGILNPERSLLLASEDRQCAVCKQMTRAIDISWEAPICSEECEGEMVLGYMKSCYLSDMRALENPVTVGDVDPVDIPDPTRWPDDKVYEMFKHDPVTELPVAILDQMIDYLMYVRKQKA